MIIVVGIGADGMAGLSEASRSEILRATVIYGSKRQLDLLDDTVPAPRRQWPSPMLPVLQTLSAGQGDVHVVASGDPLLHGIGGTLIRLHGPDNVRILPHVSSVTLACARMGWNVHDTEVISLVTTQPHTAVRRGGLLGWEALTEAARRERPRLPAQWCLRPGEPACLLPACFDVLSEQEPGPQPATRRRLLARRHD